MKKLVLALFCIAVIVGCKQEEEIKEVATTVVEVKPSKLEVKINCKSDTDDILQCVFNRIELDNNREGNYIITDKLIANKSNNFNFEMFNEDFVSLLQVRLGKEEKNLTIDSIVLQYEENKVIIDGKDLDQYFVLNQYINYDSENKTIKTIKVGGKHFPTFTLKQLVVKKLFNLN